jgi:hypothetical protein
MTLMQLATLGQFLRDPLRRGVRPMEFPGGGTFPCGRWVLLNPRNLRGRDLHAPSRTPYAHTLRARLDATGTSTEHRRLAGR